MTFSILRPGTTHYPWARKQVKSFSGKITTRGKILTNLGKILTNVDKILTNVGKKLTKLSKKLTKKYKKLLEAFLPGSDFTRIFLYGLC